MTEILFTRLDEFNTSIASLQAQITAIAPIDNANIIALSALDATAGLLTQTASAAFTKRTLTGTASRIAITNGSGAAGNPTVDIDAAYVGQSSITTLGTIGTGVWNGTIVAVAKGGTGVSLGATGGASQVLKQTSVGGNVSVGQLAFTDISGSIAVGQVNSGTGANSGTFFRGDNQWASAVTSITGGNQTIVATGTIQTDSGLGIQNLSIGATVASNLLTINVLDSSGATPTATSPARIQFRNATLANGPVSSNYITGALSINTNAVGANMGTVSGVPFRLWVLAFDNAGTTVLALYQTVSGGAAPTFISPINENEVNSTTPISGAASSAGIFYTPNGTTLTNKAFRILGYIEYAAGLATAGTYNIVPTSVQLFGPGIRKPGEVIQRGMGTVSTADTGTVSLSYVDSALTFSMTPRSAASVFIVEAYGTLTNVGTNSVAARLVRGTTQIGSNSVVSGSSVTVPSAMVGFDAPGSVASQTWKVQRKTFNAATTALYPNGDTGVMANLIVTELAV